MSLAREDLVNSEELQSELDQTDVRLLHALQIEPRASWNDLAPIVGVAPATLARRWARLTAEGYAWVTGHCTWRQMALLEIECDLIKLNAVVEELRRDDRVFVLDLTSGDRDLLAIVVESDLAAIADYAVGRLGGIDGVRTVRTHISNETLIDGGSWRLRALNTSEVARIRPPQPPRPRAARTVDKALRDVIQREVWSDGRASIAHISAASGFSPQRVSDAIATLRHTGELSFRTDMARAASGWPIYTWYFVEAPARTLQAARESIRSVPEVRLAFTSSSRHNLIIAVWLRRLSDVNRFELALEQALGGSRIVDRAVVLRIAKHMDRVIGPDTRSTGPAGGLVRAVSARH